MGSYGHNCERIKAFILSFLSNYYGYRINDCVSISNYWSDWFECKIRNVAEHLKEETNCIIN